MNPGFCRSISVSRPLDAIGTDAVELFVSTRMSNYRDGNGDVVIASADEFRLFSNLQIETPN